MTQTVTTTTRPTWADYWATVGNEDYLLVKRILEATNMVVGRDAAHWIEVREAYRDCDLDWVAWFADVDTQGRGWSSTEARVYRLVRSILMPGMVDDPSTVPSINLAEVLGQLGSWETEIWAALVEWGTGGRLTAKAAR